MQSPRPSQRLALLVRPARLAAVVAVGDLQRVLVQHGALDARPGAHVGADLLAHVAGEDSRSWRSAARRRRRTVIGAWPVQKLAQQGRARRGNRRSRRRRCRRRRPARPACLPPLRHSLSNDQGAASRRMRALRSPSKSALDIDEEVGPDRLRAGVAAPQPAEQRRDQEQRQRRHHQQAGDEIDLLRPELDDEEVEAAAGEIDQHRLVRQRAGPLPADPGRDVVDRQRDDQQRPLDRAASGRGPASG